MELIKMNQAKDRGRMLWAMNIFIFGSLPNTAQRHVVNKRLP
jgi:hypothetical protein